MPHKTLFVITFILCGLSVHCRICKSTDIRNDIAVFEQKLRNCTVIIGFLHIVLIDSHVYTERDYENLTFPELTEITGYLLLYRVYGLTSLGKLFPNLSVIRGATLFSDYALVIHQMPAMREIGLFKLAYIARGGVRVSNSYQLCFVDTVDWKKIGTSLHYYNATNAVDIACPKCSAECDGYCWNEHKCQATDDTKCHPECIGCSEYHSPKHCRVCRHYLDDGVCVSQCPPNKYKKDFFSKCMTREDCHKILGGSWFIFNNKCVRTCPARYYQVSAEEGWCAYCGDDCVKNCSGMLIDSLASLDVMKGCTHINGNLVIRIVNRLSEKVNMAEELEKNLGSIVQIDDYLKISRSDAIKSLGFFKSLKVINGKNLENNKYALILLQNADLHELWDYKNFSLEIRHGSVSIHDNPQLCYSDIERFAKLAGLKNFSDIDISPSSNGYKSSCTSITLKMQVVEYNTKNVTIAWEDYKLSHNESLVGYFVYYIEHSDENIKNYDNVDVCGDNGWVYLFVKNNSAIIKDLKPFTKYAYYIKTYSSTSADRKSEMQYFMTLADDPSEPLDVTAVATSSNSIKLTWKPPTEPNGVLSHYLIFGYMEPDDQLFLDQRNYCVDRLQGKTSKAAITNLGLNTTKSPDCCRTKSDTKHGSLCDSLAGVRLLNEEKQSCQKYMYYNPNYQLPKDNITISYEFESMQKRSGSVKKSYQPKKYKSSIEVMTHDADITSYEIKGLKHYTMYVFLISACNVNVTNRQLCSSVVMTWERTKEKSKVDDIGDVSYKIEDNNHIYISWQEPKSPNSAILAYQLSSKRVDHAHKYDACVSRVDHETANYVYHTTLPPGAYSFKIRAVSLAGPSNYSKEIKFDIIMPTKTSLAVIIFVVVFVFCLIFVSYTFYCWYRKKREVDNLHLITSINPDYEGTVYVEDEWEMDRDDVEIMRELGQGTFGMVYSGLIKSKNLPCAVKTVNEHANVHDRMEFLNEASVMKTFSDTHHVVCLLGVVSRGQPPLVIMELMERGDLKSFLRLSRDSSHCITCVEMYRMAAEIADGMAYLCAKKFVHRDLAARNCMVAHDHTVKIGDFGMARDIYETDYYRKESKGLLPVRWMAPESLADGVFTSDSDVWSYGIVLWEMTTLAEQPYQGLANEQVFQFVIAKGTLERPQECPDLLYEIMEACWKWRPNDRPLFTNIVEKLESHVGQDFRLVSFYHSREGEEYKMNTRDRVYNPPAMTVPQQREIGAHWNASDEEVSLYSGESSRPSSYFPISNQRQSRSSLGNYYHLKKKSPNSYSPFEVT